MNTLETFNPKFKTKCTEILLCGKLTEWEKDYIESVKTIWYEPSEKQRMLVDKLFKKYVTDI